MLWRRIVPAAILGVFLVLVATGDVTPWYAITLGLFAAGGAAEIYALLRRAGHNPIWAIGVPLAFLLAADAALTQWSLLPPLIIVGSLAILLVAAFSPGARHTLADWAFTATVPLYTGALLGYWTLIRLLPDGAFWVLLALGCTWIADTAAFVVGRKWGRTPLAPALSPAKTVEGAVAGIVAAPALALLVGIVAPAPHRAAPLLLGLGIVVGAAALVGDLLESWIKRQLDAKDASGLLLGHGGLLDRMDSLLATGMVAYYYLATMGR